MKWGKKVEQMEKKLKEFSGIDLLIVTDIRNNECGCYFWINKI